MSKIIVTGGAGFMGSWIANRLYQDKHSVLVLDDLSGGHSGNLSHHFQKTSFDVFDKSWTQRATFIKVDLRYYSIVKKIFKWFKPDVVYHLAANAREMASFFQPYSVVSRNMGAYVNVITSSIAAEAKRIILFSSIAVYGHQHPPFLETMPKVPVDIYGLQKAGMEEMTQMLSSSHGIEYVILRPHNVFGERQCLNDIHRNVIGIWMNKIMRQEPLTIYGDGSQKRAFSYITDSLPCYIKAMETNNQQIFNIGSDYPIPIMRAAEIVMEGMEVKSYPLQFLPNRHAEVKISYSDHTKAKSMLGLIDTNMESFQNGVAKMATWAKTLGPQRWYSKDKIEIPNDKMPEIWK